MDKEILIRSLTVEALVEKVVNGVREAIQEEKENSINQKEWLTAKEVMQLLKISSGTLYNYDKKGLTKPHKINRERRYKKEGIIELLRNIS
jgi:predicted DNA-binding transcriptional regulator AlpA